MEASLCCHKYHGKEALAEPTCPTAKLAHLIAEPSLANDSHILFYIYFKFSPAVPILLYKNG
jgi:hypothetical protein